MSLLFVSDLLYWLGRKTGEEMPRGKEEEVIEQSLTARVTSRKRGATKQWQEVDEVRKHAKLSSKQVAKNAKDKLSSVLNKVKRDDVVETLELLSGLRRLRRGTLTSCCLWCRNH
mgnify:CR=1 FL=1